MPRDTLEAAIHICITLSHPISNIFIKNCQAERHKVDSLQVATELWHSRECTTFTTFHQRESERA